MLYAVHEIILNLHVVNVVVFLPETVDSDSVFHEFAFSQDTEIIPSEVA